MMSFCTVLFIDVNCRQVNRQFSIHYGGYNISIGCLLKVGNSERVYKAVILDTAIVFVSHRCLKRHSFGCLCGVVSYDAKAKCNLLNPS